MRKFMVILLLILLLGCKANEEPLSSVGSNDGESAGEKVICSIDFPFDPVGIQWMNNNSLFLIGRNKRNSGDPQPLADQLFLFNMLDYDLTRLDLSQIKGFDYSYYWNNDSGYNNSNLFLEKSTHEKDNAFFERVIVKIPLNQPSEFETARHKLNFETQRSSSSEQGKYILSPKSVVSNRFTIVDAFTGEEIDSQTDLLYQMEAAQISPDLSRLFIHHPEEDSHTYPWYHENDERLAGGSQEGYTGVFSMENGELLYLLKKSWLNGVTYWSQSGTYLLSIDYDYESAHLSVQIYRAEDGAFLLEKSLEQVRWQTHDLAGDFLYCMSTNQKTLSLLNLSTGETSTTTFSTSVEEFGVSPDGTKAAIAHDDKIKIISLDR